MSYDDDDDDDSHILGSRLSLLSARPAVTFPAAEGPSKELK